MGKRQTKRYFPAQHQWQRVRLVQYVYRRNGVPLGDSNSLRNMFIRSFGAGSFARFWQYWNPIFGYGLGKYVYITVTPVYVTSHCAHCDVCCLRWDP